MTIETELRRQPPDTLSRARAIAHMVVHFPSKAARANLTAAPDDSHADVGWDADTKEFRSRSLPGKDGQVFVCMSISPMKLRLDREGHAAAALDLEGVSVNDAAAWLDGQLESAGLKAGSGITLPYELPPDVANVETLAPAAEAETLAALSAWFDLAHGLLSNFAANNAALSPGPSAVRCWPHHFDIATYVSLEPGEFETAKAIGVGLSPGDENYDQPYFYINPWPSLSPDGLPDLPAPGHWHTEGFVGAIATAEEVLSLTDIAVTLPLFVDKVFAIGRQQLGV